MDIVIDANVLVAELLRDRGRALLKSNEIDLFAAEKVVEETRHELVKRVKKMQEANRFSEAVGEQLLKLATEIIDIYISLVPLSDYSSLEAEAKKRIPRDLDDWHTIAVSLTLEAAIWTEDKDFFGCGCPVWTTETLLIQLEDI